MTKKALVLLSGGMDSLVIMAKAIKEFDEVYTLHLTYGQNTEDKEKDCFLKICDHYKVPEGKRSIIDVSFLSRLGGSSLTDQSMKVEDYSEEADGIPTSYVPFRNTHILSMATSVAEVHNIEHIIIGANYEDSPGYPDCRPEYYKAFNELLRLGTKKGNIKVHTPIIMDTKAQIIEKGRQLNAPFELSWSCYKSYDLACGKCDSCALRLRGFKELGLIDPIKYAKS